MKKNRLYGRVICRCETVTEAEIIAAIKAPCGAKTVDGVKRRTRAGMGRCQGGFCRSARYPDPGTGTGYTRTGSFERTCCFSICFMKKTIQMRGKHKNEKFI